MYCERPYHFACMGQQVDSISGNIFPFSFHAVEDYGIWDKKYIYCSHVECNTSNSSDHSLPAGFTLSREATHSQTMRLLKLEGEHEGLVILIQVNVCTLHKLDVHVGIKSLQSTAASGQRKHFGRNLNKIKTGHSAALPKLYCSNLNLVWFCPCFQYNFSLC